MVIVVLVLGIGLELALWFALSRMRTGTCTALCGSSCEFVSSAIT